MKKYIVNTPCGQVQGTDCRLKDVVAFKGIRYATAGRWEYPKQITHWEGVYEATKYGNCAISREPSKTRRKIPTRDFTIKNSERAWNIPMTRIAFS